MIEFNINYYIEVQLTDIGRKALKDKHDKLNEFSGNLLGEYSPPEEDEDGWSRWQMWDLMKGIGDRFGNGLNVPILTTIKIDTDHP